jgi:hypothetical protein
LPGVRSTYQNLPVELAAEAPRVADAIAKHVDRVRLLES